MSSASGTAAGRPTGRSAATCSPCSRNTARPAKKPPGPPPARRNWSGSDSGDRSPARQRWRGPILRQRRGLLNERLAPAMPFLDPLENLGHALHFAGRALLAAPLALARPRELARQLSDILVGALPLAVAAGLAL